MARSPQVVEQQRRRKTGMGNSSKDGQQRARTADSATLEDQCHPRKIFVGGLPHKTTTQQLREHFGQFGTIVDAVVLRWPDGRSRGFGYVTFTAASAAAAVLCQTHRIAGRQIDTKRAVPGTNKLFVGGLPQNCVATELREHFEAFGVVSDAVVMIDPATNRSRGFGFVCFLPGQEGAVSVATALENYDHHRIRGKWIEVKSAVSPHKLAVNETGSSQDAGWTPGPVQSNDEAANQDSCCSSIVAPEEVTNELPQPEVTRTHFLAPPPGLVEPRKVALPTCTPTMAAALAAVSSPEALAAARRATYSVPPSEPAMVMPGSAATKESEPRHLTSGRGFWSLFRAHEENSNLMQDGHSNFLCEKQPGAFTTSESLQRSLEQLLRQRSQLAGSDADGSSIVGQGQAVN